MSKVRIVYKADGTVAVLHPSLASRRQNETEDQWLDRVFTKMMKGNLEGLPYDDVDSSELPQAREDRDAWTGKKGEGISVDQVKAAKLKADKEAKTKIGKKIRDTAIDSLIAKGELPPDYDADDDQQ